MNWDAISAIVGILTLLFTAFLEWPRFRSRLPQGTFISRNLIWGLGGMVIAIGVIVWLIGMRDFDPAKGYSTQALIGQAMFFGAFSIIYLDLILTDLKNKKRNLLWFTGYWGLMSLGMTIVSIYFLITR